MKLASGKATPAPGFFEDLSDDDLGEDEADYLAARAEGDALLADYLASRGER